MSFKIFSLQLTGKIKPVEKIEKQRDKLHKNYLEFLAVEKSDELKEYLALEAFLNSAEFKKKKAEIDKFQFKGSKEYNDLMELKKLENSKKIRRYFKVADSQDISRFNKISETDKPEEYKNLRDYMTGGRFAADKKEKKEDALTKKNKYQTLKGDSDLRFYLKFKKSSLYKNYLDVKSSNDLKRLTELKERTSSKEFRERKAYLEDKNKWEKTEEFKKTIKYEEIKKQPHIQNYFKYKNSTDFDFFKNWEVTFEDNFSGILDAEKWSVLNKWSEKIIGENYSLPGDLHCFTAGKNIKTSNKLTIEVKKESVNGKVWKMSAGFLPADFEYTSGFVSSLESFGQGNEIYEAKIKFTPVKKLVSTFYLAGTNNTPMVHLLEMGTKNRLGVSVLDNSGKIQMEGLDISNLKAGKWYIFTIERSDQTLIWKINETEVYRINREVKQPLFLNASTVVIDDIPGHQLPNNFEIEWVKCYRKSK